MKSYLKPFAAFCVVAFMASQAMAQVLVNQAPVGDTGSFAVQDQAYGAADPWLAMSFDNFTLTEDSVIEGFGWSGLYAEPLPAAISDTDFIVQIWGLSTTPANNLPDVWGGPLMTFMFEGGVVAGQGGADLTVTPETGYTSAAIEPNITPGGGEVFHYDASIAGTALAAGDYWISIIAEQNFDNAPPVIDPEWQWHYGSGPGDGFTYFDRQNQPAGTNRQGLLVEGKDLAFTIKGVPEPSTMLMALCGLAPLGLLRRKRQS